MSDCFYFRHLIFKHILPTVGSCRYYFFFLYVGNYMIYDQRLSIYYYVFYSINISTFTTHTRTHIIILYYMCMWLTCITYYKATLFASIRTYVVYF